MTIKTIDLPFHIKLYLTISSFGWGTYITILAITFLLWLILYNTITFTPPTYYHIKKESLKYVNTKHGFFKELLTSTTLTTLITLIPIIIFSLTVLGKTLITSPFNEYHYVEGKAKVVDVMPYLKSKSEDISIYDRAMIKHHGQIYYVTIEKYRHVKKGDTIHFKHTDTFTNANLIENGQIKSYVGMNNITHNKIKTLHFKIEKE